jgi:hypothetical protein
MTADELMDGLRLAADAEPWGKLVNDWRAIHWSSIH